MTLDVYRGRLTTIQQQQQHFPMDKQTLRSISGLILPTSLNQFLSLTSMHLCIYLYFMFDEGNE